MDEGVLFFYSVYSSFSELTAFLRLYYELHLLDFTIFFFHLELRRLMCSFSLLLFLYINEIKKKNKIY